MTSPPLLVINDSILEQFLVVFSISNISFSECLMHSEIAEHWPDDRHLILTLAPSVSITLLYRTCNLLSNTGNMAETSCFSKAIWPEYKTEHEKQVLQSCRTNPLPKQCNLVFSLRFRHACDSSWNRAHRNVAPFPGLFAAIRLGRRVSGKRSSTLLDNNSHISTVGMRPEKLKQIK